MDVWQFFGYGLLQYPERDSDSLQIFGACGDMYVYWFKSGVVDDGILPW